MYYQNHPKWVLKSTKIIQNPGENEESLVDLASLSPAQRRLRPLLQHLLAMPHERLLDTTRIGKNRGRQ
jgi:hypothetical protein